MPTMVSVIPATHPSPAGQSRQDRLLRVAAYCRVSTGEESQQTSYATQKAYYTQLITGKPGWLLAGIYADEALSGTSRVRRTQFNRMMEDARAGKLDYIVSKSISRFARNTVDTLTCIRQLRQLDPPVGVFFEKENIDTLDASGELVLTILSALAQEESRSISGNIRWAIQKNFQAGKPTINLNRMLGYDSGPDGQWLVNPDQAEIVRDIFTQFVGGRSANRIADGLNRLGKTTVNGKRWTAGGVLTVLRNEKYTGDLEMQKTVTRDYLTHRSTVNCGEAPRYYVENHHEPIIDRLLWNKAQAILGTKAERTRSASLRGTQGSPFRNLLCGGLPLRRMTYSASAPGWQDGRCLAATGLAPGEPGEIPDYRERYGYSYPVWRCPKGSCPAAYREAALEQSFMELLYRLKREETLRGSDSSLHRAFRQAQDRAEALEQGNQPSPLPAPPVTQIPLPEALEANFRFFLQCLQALPDRDPAGRLLCIHGLDTGEGPDLLPFEQGIFRAFFESGDACGDRITYRTSFGVPLTTLGNCRTLKDFLGFRQWTPEGAMRIIDAPWQVGGYPLRYHRSRKPAAEKSGDAVP